MALALESNAKLETELRAKVVDYVSQTPSEEQAAAPATDVSAIETEYATAIAKLREELALALESNAKLETELRALAPLPTAASGLGACAGEACDREGLEAQIESLTEELDTATFRHEQVVKVSQMHVEMLEQQVQQLTEELEETKEKLDEAGFVQRETQTASQQYVASLEAQISTLQEAQEGSASAGEATKAVVQGVVQELQSTLAEKSAAVEDVTAQLAAKDAQLASQEKDAQVALAALQSKCDELQGLLAKAKEGKAATEKEMEDILAREAKLQGTLDGKTIRITSLEAELARTKEAQGGDAVIAAREVSAAPVGSCSADTARIAQLESELEKAKEASSGSSTQHAALVSGLETQLVAAKAVANQLEADKEALAAEVTALQARLANLEAAAKAAPAMPTASEEAALKDVAALQQKVTELEQELSDAKTRLESTRGVDVLQQQVMDLTRDVKRLVETGRELGEEGRRQREDLRQAEVVKRELTDKVVVLEAEVARLREGKTSHSNQWDQTRADLEAKYLDSESRRQNLQVDLKLADAERSRLRTEVERLSVDVNTERLNVHRLEQELEHERLRSTGSLSGSPSRAHEGGTALLQAEDRCRQLQDEVLALKKQLGRGELGEQQFGGSSGDEGVLRGEIRRLRAALQDSEQARRTLEEQRGDVSDVHGRDLGPIPIVDGQGCRLCNERNMRIRTLLKEKAECHAQVRQLSSEVVGLTEALEMVTRRAQEKDVRHTELQAKMEKIVRLAGLVDPLLALEARAEPMKVGLKKKKLRAKGSSKTGRQPSPIHSRGGNSLTPPRRQQAEEAWGAPQGRLPMMAAARPYGAVSGVQVNVGRPRPQSARARIDHWREDGHDPANGFANANARQEYLPSASNSRASRPLSANASSEILGGPYPPPANSRRPAPLNVRADPNGEYSQPSSAYSQIQEGLPAQEQGFVGNMRPFSYLVKCVKEGSVTAQTELRIVIEYCNSEHYSRRHDIGRYQQIYERVASALREQLRGRIFTISYNKESGHRNAVDVEPRAGAFEVYVEWSDAKVGAVNAVVLFSKLETMRYPNPANVAARLRAVLHGGDDNLDQAALGGQESDALNSDALQE